MKALKAFAAIAVAASALSASADVDSYLYWMVGDTVKWDTTYFTSADPEATVDYDYAKVSADGGATYLNLYDTSGSLGMAELDKGEVGMAGFSSSPAFSSFLIELYNESDQKVGWTTLPYSRELAYIYSNPTEAGSPSVFTVTSVIPEPTGGLLLLLGLSGLALRRRRAAAVA